MRDRSLYGIAGEFAALEALLDDIEDGQVTEREAEQIQTWVRDLEGALEDKVDHVVAYIKDLAALASERAQEAARLQALADAGTKRTERLREALFATLESTGHRKVETRRFVVTIVGNGGSQPMRYPDDARALPLVYQKRRTIITADTEALRRDLLQGIAVPDCALLPRGKRLSIK